METYQTSPVSIKGLKPSQGSLIKLVSKRVYEPDGEKNREMQRHEEKEMSLCN